MLFAQTNKISLLHSERYRSFPNAMKTSTKKNGFAWLKRKGRRNIRVSSAKFGMALVGNSYGAVYGDGASEGVQCCERPLH